MAGLKLRATLARLALAVVVCAASTGSAPLRAQSRPLPARGEPSAPIVILLFSDFQCPYCARVEPVLQEVRARFPKDVQVVFKHSPLPIHPQAPLAHEAAIEAGRQGKFWEMHDLLFANQQKLQRDDLAKYAAQLGLDVAAFSRALDERTHRPLVERDLAEARALGVTGTPALFVNGRRSLGVPAATQLIAAIDGSLNGGPSPESDVVAPATFDLSGSPTRGPDKAPVTIVEFSDFQCGFCARANSTIARLLAKYEGRVRLVFKHYPLEFHPDAPLAHRAALAAHEQGRFWEMHDAIFASQRAMKREDLLKHASALGLDRKKFAAALDAKRLEAVLARDMAEGGKAGVDGTPTFFVNGRRLVGAQPFEVFAAAVDRALAATKDSPADALDLAMSRGPADAPVTIRWFADLTSPLHREAVLLLKRVVAAHPEEVRIVLRHAPSVSRANARLLHEAAVSGAEQGRFWEMHDLLMMRPTLDDRDVVADQAARLRLDRAAFLDGLTSGRASRTVMRDLAEAHTLDVRGTPTLFVNDVRVDGLVDFDELDAIVRRAADPTKAANVARH